MVSSPSLEVAYKENNNLKLSFGKANEAYYDARQLMPGAREKENARDNRLSPNSTTFAPVSPPAMEMHDLFQLNSLKKDQSLDSSNEDSISAPINKRGKFFEGGSVLKKTDGNKVEPKVSPFREMFPPEPLQIMKA